MNNRVAAAALPLYLFVCLLAGGSAQGVVANLLLQIIGIALIAGALIARSHRNAPVQLGSLPWTIAALVALVLVQFLPLPPLIWSSLPGRQFIAEGFALLGQGSPWLPWTLSWEGSLSALIPVIVPVAILAWAARSAAFQPALIVVALLTATILGVLLGLLQVRSGGTEFYLYRFSAFGQAAGFFANSNHMGTLLLASVPLGTALAADQYRARRDTSQRGLVVGIAAGLALVMLIAMVLNRSTAVMVLGGPVVLLSLAIPVWQRPVARKLLVGVGLLAMAGAVGLGAFQGKFSLTSEDSSIATRSEIWSTTARAIDAFKFSGTGLGTFERVYRHVENPATVDRTYVNHAHNDLLELTLELGVPGLLLLAAFLRWWATRAFKAWTIDNRIFARAGSIATGAILLHSLVDFPLRTAAIAAVFATGLAMMALRVNQLRSDGRSELWPPRHHRVD